MGKVLVLDVDETLLNIERLSFLRIFKKNYADSGGKVITFPGSETEYYISLRPGTTEFLEEARKHFRLAAFSVVGKEITAKKLKSLGICRYFEKIYGQEDLIDRKKHLDKISRDFNVQLKEIVAIDDNPSAFDLQERVISINPWFIGSKADPSELAASLEQAKLM